VRFAFSSLSTFGGSSTDVLAIATDSTDRVIAARRQGVLADLAGRCAAITPADEACRTGVDALCGDAADIAFAVIYVVDGEALAARLVAAKGTGAHGAGRWPLAEALQQDALLCVEGLAGNAKQAADMPDKAVLVPLTSAGDAGPPAVLVVGVNPRRRY